MTEPSGVIAFACVIGLPPSTSASPSVPNQPVQACVAWSCSSFDSGIEPPWNVSRKFAMPKHLHRAATLVLPSIRATIATRAPSRRTVRPGIDSAD